MKDFNKLVQAEIDLAEVSLINDILQILKAKRLYNVCGQFVRWETSKEAYSRSEKEIKALHDKKSLRYLDGAKLNG